MFKRFLIISVVCLLSHAASAQEGLSLIPCLADDYGETVNTILMDKLRQVALLGGRSGAGYEDRFVITAHITPLEKQTTGTVPARTAVRLGVTFYIGDGYDGTLYSSYPMELRGVGDDETQARINAVRKIQADTPEARAFVSKGEQRLLSYYEDNGARILASAKAEAESGMYDKAIISLMAIPASCSYYNQAQDLIARYGQPAINNRNAELLLQARSVWSTSPNETGAARARKILAGIRYPGKAVETEIRELSNEISGRLKEERDRQWELLTLEIQNAHERDLAEIGSERDIMVAHILAAAEIKAAQASRPVVNYNVYWW